MFITEKQIYERRAALVEHSLEHKLFGAEIFYYVLLENGTHVCGMPCRIVGMRPGATYKDSFHVDLAVESPVENIFLLLEDLHVDSMSLEHRQSGTPVGAAVCKVEDIPRVSEIVNAPRFSDGLKVVK